MLNHEGKTCIFIGEINDEKDNTELKLKLPKIIDCLIKSGFYNFYYMHLSSFEETAIDIVIDVKRNFYPFIEIIDTGLIAINYLNRDKLIFCGDGHSHSEDQLKFLDRDDEIMLNIFNSDLVITYMDDIFRGNNKFAINYAFKIKKTMLKI